MVAPAIVASKAAALLAKSGAAEAALGQLAAGSQQAGLISMVRNGAKTKGVEKALGAMAPGKASEGSKNLADTKTAPSADKVHPGSMPNFGPIADAVKSAAKGAKDAIARKNIKTSLPSMDTGVGVEQSLSALSEAGPGLGL